MYVCIDGCQSVILNVTGKNKCRKAIRNNEIYKMLISLTLKKIHMHLNAIQ